MRNFLCKIMLFVLLLLGILWINQPVVSAHSLIPNSCQYGSLNYQNAAPPAWTPRGTLTASTATTWSYSNGCFSWAADANANGPSGGWGIQTEIAGYDRCNNTDVWNEDFHHYHLNTANSTYTNAGLTYGNYFDCSQGSNHHYMVEDWPGWYVDSTTLYDSWGSYIY